MTKKQIELANDISIELGKQRELLYDLRDEVVVDDEDEPRGTPEYESLDDAVGLLEEAIEAIDDLEVDE